MEGMPRILGQPVPARFPAVGPVGLLLYGEAPGPRGADQSGIPFWGDRAGLPVYRALATAGLAQVPEAAWEAWDGARLRALGLVPTLAEVALSNAYPACPTQDGDHFHAPTNQQLLNPENLARLRGELQRAQSGQGQTLRVITFGRRAAWVLDQLGDLPALVRHELPHPPAQGLLQGAPNRGKGLKLDDLRRAWEDRLLTLLSTS